MHNLKSQIIRDKKHLKFVASLNCCVCKRGGNSQAAHIGITGKSCKAGDDKTAPLCTIWWDEKGHAQNGCHETQTIMGHEKFWEPYGGKEKALELATNLYKHTGDWTAAMGFIARF